MKKMKKLFLVMVGGLLLLAPLTAAGPKVPYDHEGFTSRDFKSIPEDINWVTVEEIEKSLEGVPPMVVSFDIDDTTLFSSGIFSYGKDKFSPGSNDYLKNQKYWDLCSKTGDMYSLPKKSAKALIDMHQRRGDQVIFITGRTGPKGYKWDKLDPVAKTLQKMFDIKDMKPIFYRDQKYKEETKYDKTYHILRQNSKLHYGDSDDDILAAKEAGIRGIRVIRSPMSNHEPFPMNGGYGEEVLIDSYF